MMDPSLPSLTFRPDGLPEVPWVKRKVQLAAGGKIEDALQAAGIAVTKSNYPFPCKILLDLATGHKRSGLSLHVALEKALGEFGAAAMAAHLTPQELQGVQVPSALVQYYVQTHARFPGSHVLRYAVVGNPEALAKFRGTPGGSVTLSSSGTPASSRAPMSLAEQIKQHNKAVHTELLARLRTMNPKAFEEFIGRLFRAIGFEEVAVTPNSRDGGVDVLATAVMGSIVRVPCAAQVKRKKEKDNVGRRVISDLRGSMVARGQCLGFIMTTSDFSPDARKEAALTPMPPIELINGEELSRRLITHGIGAVRDAHGILTLTDEGDTP